jgi:hypothetical protein
LRPLLERQIDRDADERYDRDFSRYARLIARVK